MSVSGLCAICQSAQAVDTCRQCGSAVCEQHYERGRGLCQECAAAMEGA